MVPSVGPGRWLRVHPSVVWLPGVDGRVIALAISSAPARIRSQTKFPLQEFGNAGYDFYGRSSTLGAGTQLRYLPWMGVVRGVSANMEGSSGWTLIRDKTSSLIWVEAGARQNWWTDIARGLDP